MTPHPDLEDYPVVIKRPLSWGDMDAYGHLNNVMHFRYFEDARIAYMHQCGWLALKESAGIGPIVASAQARYRKPVHYPDVLLSGVRIAQLLPDRVVFDHRLVSEQAGGICAQGEVVMVNYDYHRNQKTPFLEHQIIQFRQIEPNLILLSPEGP
jgi:acyl-CoA thioester hydrolase